MTKLRALHGALASGAICLTLGTATQAGEANYDVTGSMSEVSNSCVAPLIGIVGLDCTYNQSAAGTWVGPVHFARYYAPGTSPFQTAAGGARPEPPLPDNGAELAITGTLTIDDINETSCDGDDTIVGSFILSPGTRTFTAGQGEWAEETWGADTIVYDLPVTVPNLQTTLGDGSCEYIIGGDGGSSPPFPELLQTVGGLTFPADVAILGPGSAKPGDDDWIAPEQNGIGIGAREGATGIAISLNDAAFAGGDWSCADFAGGDAVGPESCATIDSASSACKEGGQNFCGQQRTQENWQFRIVVAPSGDITEDALIIAGNDYTIFQNNDSWDADVITFTADCTDCSVAKNDNYRIVSGTPSPVALDIGANDLAEALNTAATTLNIDAQPANGSCDADTYSQGPVTDIVCDFTSNDNFATPVTFTYTLDDGILQPEAGLQATVSIAVEADATPVANAFTVELDSRGVDPATLSAVINVTADIPGNAGGNDPAVSDDGSASLGTVTDDGDVTLNYAVTNGDAFLVKGTTDTFDYTITDNNFGGGTAGPETASNTVTVQLAPADPEAFDAAAGPIEGGKAAPFTAVITPGNGSVAQHTVDGSCDDGEIEITDVAVNGSTVEVSGEYTAPEGIEGEVICEYTITDGEGDTATGEIVIEVTSGAVILLPGSGSAVAPATLGLLLLSLFARRMRRKLSPASHKVSGVQR